MTLPALWLGMVGGPIAWLLYLQLSYMLAPRACQAGDKTALAVVAVVALVATIAITIVAWRAWHASGADYTPGKVVSLDGVDLWRFRVWVFLR